MRGGRWQTLMQAVRSVNTPPRSWDFFSNDRYWEKVKQEIFNKRNQREKEICQQYFILLSEEDQALSLELQQKELNDFVREMGFPIGEYVVDQKNKPWKVVWIASQSGLLRVDDISISLRDTNGNRKCIYSRNPVIHGLKEDQYFDCYRPTTIESGNNNAMENSYRRWTISRNRISSNKRHSGS
jgi:hypothetical protein